MESSVLNSPTMTLPSDADHPTDQSVLNKTVNAAIMPIKITVILPTSAYFMSGVRDFTKTIVMNMTGFSEQWAYRFQSVVDELTNNAIEFGSAPGQSIQVTFVSLKGQSIEVFVEDTGTGVSRKKASDMMALITERKQTDPTKLTSIRGRGLSQIVANWTDKLEFTDNEKGGLTVHVIKYLNEGEK